MNTPPPQGREDQVRDIFTRIAPRYDLMNRLMTGGRDILWRREVIARASLTPGDRLLDLGAGTGDLAGEALRQEPGCRPVAADFTLAMLHTGQRRYRSGDLDWCGADALRLPYPPACFDAVVSGFLLRNVADLQLALREQRRVLKPGGRLVILDTTRPRPTPFSPLVQLQLRVIIPTLGWLLTGQRDAYTYLPTTTQRYLRAEELVARLAAVGFKEIGFRTLMFGTIAIHWARK